MRAAFMLFPSITNAQSSRSFVASFDFAISMGLTSPDALVHDEGTGAKLRLE
jgi:hypothetical protein